jgi:quercetin dioxygenase-like cupin family protein
MNRAIAVITVLLLGSALAPAQDPVRVAAKQCKVLLENDYVRVLHWTIGPHEKSEMHEHPPVVSVSLTGGKTRYISPDGKNTDIEGKPGQVTWSGPQKHASENLGDKAGEVVQVELKKRPGSNLTAVPAAEGALTVDPQHYKLEFQNDRVRVLRIHYGPGEKSLMHSHPAGVAVFLTGGDTKMTLPDGTSKVMPSKPGQVQWNDKQKHLPENASGKPFELVLVELK